MKQKEFWTIVIVAAIVGVIASVATASFMSNPSLSPYTTAKAINANDCSADGECEVNSLYNQLIDGESYKNFKITRGQIEIDGSVSSGSNATSESFFNNLVLQISDSYPEERETHWLYASSTNLDLVARRQGYPEERLTIRPEGITGGYLSGNGTAYVCADSYGKLFRSNTACR